MSSDDVIRNLHVGPTLSTAQVDFDELFQSIHRAYSLQSLQTLSFVDQLATCNVDDNTYLKKAEACFTQLRDEFDKYTEVYQPVIDGEDLSKLNEILHKNRIQDDAY